MIYLLIIWVGFILVATCTSDVHAFLQSGKVTFEIVSNPNWLDFLVLFPPTNAGKIELLGHITMFFVLSLLLFTVMNHTKHVFLLAATFGGITEILQLFFGRGGVFYDFVADIIGGIFGITLYVILRKLVTKQHREWIEG